MKYCMDNYFFGHCGIKKPKKGTFSWYKHDSQHNAQHTFPGVQEHSLTSIVKYQETQAPIPYVFAHTIQLPVQDRPLPYRYTLVSLETVS